MSCRYSQFLMKRLVAGSGGSITTAQRAAMERRVDDYYVPVYKYFKNQLLSKSTKSSDEKGKNKPHFVGISAPQGCGKTTLVEFMRDLFAIDGHQCVVMSLDDFYLTKSEQDEYN